MKVFLLPFGKVNILESNIAEIIINEGVLIDRDMVASYRALIRKHLQIPYSLLINKEHGYSYTFEAQITMGELDQDVDHRAVVVNSQSGEMATEIVLNVNKKNNWNLQMFKERKDAVEWLINEQNNKTAI